MFQFRLRTLLIFSLLVAVLVFSGEFRRMGPWHAVDDKGNPTEGRGFHIATLYGALSYEYVPTDHIKWNIGWYEYERLYYIGIQENCWHKPYDPNEPDPFATKQ